MVGEVGVPLVELQIYEHPLQLFTVAAYKPVTTPLHAFAKPPIVPLGLVGSVIINGPVTGFEIQPLIEITKLSYEPADKFGIVILPEDAVPLTVCGLPLNV